MTTRNPYFMSNEKWYRIDYEKRRIVLTDDAPPEAVESYKKTMEKHERYRHGDIHE